MTGESLAVFICPSYIGCNYDPEEKNTFAYAGASGNLYSSLALTLVNDITVEPKYFFYVRFYLLVSIS